MSVRKKASRKQINIKDLLNPTFSVPVRGTRQRMSAYEIGLRNRAKSALETKDPKAIHDLIKLLMEHEIFKSDASAQLSGVVRYPWYWDFHACVADINAAKAIGTKLPRNYKIKLIKPLTEAGRRDIEEKEGIKTIPAKSRSKTEGVGYRKPPIDKQFKKGTSGNPRGRLPSANDRRAVINRVANSEVIINDKGGPRKLRISEALLVILCILHVQGKVTKYYDNTIRKILPENPDGKSGALFLPTNPPPEEFAAQVNELRIKIEEMDRVERENDEKVRQQMEEEWKRTQ